MQFILSVLEGEFGFIGINRPDLVNIPETYQKNNSNFWIAIENDKVIGTIALENHSDNRGYLKRFYVDKAYRGKGIAQQLLAALVQYAKDNNYKKILLATFEDLVAANKFYNKTGFIRIESLPKDMDDGDGEMFYQMDIGK